MKTAKKGQAESGGALVEQQEARIGAGVNRCI
jgi:hypothetical protein